MHGYVPPGIASACKTIVLDQQEDIRAWIHLIMCVWLNYLSWKPYLKKYISVVFITVQMHGYVPPGMIPACKTIVLDQQQGNQTWIYF